MQCNATLAITGTIIGSSIERLYKELGSEFFQQRRWNLKNCHFLKITKNQCSKYLFELIPTARQAYMTRYKSSIPLFNINYVYFKNSFFLSIIIEWNNLKSNIGTLRACHFSRNVYWFS